MIVGRAGAERGRANPHSSNLRCSTLFWWTDAETQMLYVNNLPGVGANGTSGKQGCGPCNTGTVTLP